MPERRLSARSLDRSQTGYGPTKRGSIPSSPRAKIAAIKRSWWTSAAPSTGRENNPKTTIIKTGDADPSFGSLYRPCSCPMPTRHAATFSSRDVSLPLASGVPDRRLSASLGQKRALYAGYGRLPAGIPLTVPVPAECLPRRFSRRTANAAASERKA